MSAVRIDKYLWAIRLFRTRTLASTACDQGKIRIAGTPVKASRHVGLGEEYEIKTEARRWVIRITGIIDKRVQYSEAIDNYLDLTPEEEAKSSFQASAFFTGKRNSKIGRPTKKDRRDLDDFKERP